MRSAVRREARRVRRGRQAGSQQGRGHGETIYVPVRRTNRMVTEDEREARREVLVERGDRDQARLRAIRKRLEDEV
jgi:hypothetical protein